jgi:hypothetical protein
VTARTVLAPEPPRRASARERLAPWPASCRRVALRLLPGRGAPMRRTDFCHLTFRTSTRAPSVPIEVEKLSLLPRLGTVCSTQTIRFGGPHLWFISPRGSLSYLHGGCEPSLWHPCRGLRFVLALSRPDSGEDHPVRPSAVRVKPARPNDRPGVPSVWQGPSPRSALSSARLRPAPAPRLGHRDMGCRLLWVRSLPSRAFGAPGSRSRDPLPAGCALL